MGQMEKKIPYYWSLILIKLFQISMCCHDGYLFDEPSSKSVDIGKSVSFFCNGRGSYLYWFVDDINTEDMTSQEMSDRGLSTSGFYNYIPPYIGCNDQYSYLTMAGNCLNNNSEVYCVILGRGMPSDGGGNQTSLVATLTVKAVISQFSVVQTGINSLLMHWDYGSASSETQSVVIMEDSETVYDMKLNTWDRFQEYSSNTLNPCVQYNITLTVGFTCGDSTDSWTISKYLLSGETLKPQILSMQRVDQTWHQDYLIQLKVNSSLCQGSIPVSIKLILLDNNDDLLSSDTILWNNLTMSSANHEVYQIKWSGISLLNNTHYQLLILSQTAYGQIVSNPFVISTFDVTDVQYTFDNISSVLCVKCLFINNTQAMGCLVVLQLITDDLPLSVQAIMKIPRDIPSNNHSGSDCITITNGGHYSMLVYDWEESGVWDNQEPAIETTLHIDVPKGITTTINSCKSSLSKTSDIYSSMNDLATVTVIVFNPQQEGSNLPVMGTALAFGILFALCLVVLMILVGLLLRQKKKYCKNNGGGAPASTSAADITMATMQTNLAYQSIKMDEAQTTTTVGQCIDDVQYETLSVTSDSSTERYQYIKPPIGVDTDHDYVYSSIMHSTPAPR